MVPGGGCGITYSLVGDWLMSSPANVSGFMFIDRMLQMMAKALCSVNVYAFTICRAALSNRNLNASYAHSLKCSSHIF